jgi:hypothetical protein
VVSTLLSRGVRHRPFWFEPERWEEYLRWSSWEPFQKEKGRVEVSEKLKKMATMEDKEII